MNAEPRQQLTLIERIEILEQALRVARMMAMKISRKRGDDAAKIVYLCDKALGDRGES